MSPRHRVGDVGAPPAFRISNRCGNCVAFRKHPGDDLGGGDCGRVLVETHSNMVCDFYEMAGNDV